MAILAVVVVVAPVLMFAVWLFNSIGAWVGVGGILGTLLAFGLTAAAIGTLSSIICGIVKTLSS